MFVLVVLFSVTLDTEQGHLNFKKRAILVLFLAIFIQPFFLFETWKESFFLAGIGFSFFFDSLLICHSDFISKALTLCRTVRK